MSLGPPLSILSHTRSHVWVLCSAICPSFCQMHAPTLGCSPTHFHLSLSSINPTLGISLFVRLTLFYSSSPSPSLPCHSVLLVGSFVWHLFILSLGSGLGWFIPTGTFLFLFSTLGEWFLTCINPFIYIKYVLIFMKLINFNFCLGLMKGCLPIRNITRI